MEDDKSNIHELDLEKSDRPVWLMKSPVVVAKAWGKQAPSSSSSFSSSGFNSLAKVVESFDPLHSETEVLGLLYIFDYRFSVLDFFY